MTEQHGPDSEQLDLAEDVERLAEIGDLILAGYGRIEDFDLKKYETIFVQGYLDAGARKRSRTLTDEDWAA